MQVEKIRRIFTDNKSRIFISDSLSGLELTYGDLEKKSLQFAALLKEKGIGRGDRVAVLLPNCLEFVVIYFGCMQAGAIAVPINPLLHQNEVEYIIANSNAVLIIVAKGDEARWANRFADTEILPLPLFERLDGFDADSRGSFEGVRDEDTVVIIYTSGTTARPKAVVISYRNVIKNGIAFTRLVGVGRENRFLGMLSLAYMGGWYNLLLIPFFAEGSLVLSDTFNAETSLSFWDTVIRYKVNTLWFVPAIMSILLSLDRGDKGRLYCVDNIRLSMVGTAPLPLKLKEEFEQKYRISLQENYGLSETFFISTNAPGIPYRVNSVGRLLPGCDLKILDIDTGMPLPVGKKGEIAVKTEYFMKGYLDSSADAPSFHADEYFMTGDVGFADEDGYLYITGRKKDLIIRGGINISPREIEEILRRNEHVDDVAVVGTSDKVYGENIAAVIKLKKESKGKVSERSMGKFCLDNLASFKCPSRIYFIDEFPRSVTGKVQKNRLKDIIENTRNVKE